MAVDNTFATPLLQSPLALGADFAVHSATKYVGGHSDLLMGVVVCRTAGDHARLLRRREVAGATPGALETYLALRGARTLALRLRQAQRSAGVLAARLADHPAVARVRYPGLPDRPAPRPREPARCAGPARWSPSSSPTPPRPTPSWTACGWWCTPPASGASSRRSSDARSCRARSTCRRGLLRLSVGCEHVEDLWDDLDAALPAG